MGLRKDEIASILEKYGFDIPSRGLAYNEYMVGLLLKSVENQNEIIELLRNK